MSLEYHPDDPIVAPATPLTESALSVVRTSGKASIGLVSTIFSRPERLMSAPGHSAVHGDILNRDAHPIDEVVLVVFRSPRSFTGEDSVEIIGHGSPLGVRLMIDELHRVGFRTASPGEFTLRAFLNGKMDLTRAAAVGGLIEAKTERAHELARNRLNGRMTEQYDTIRQSLLDLSAPVELSLDYPEEETGEAETGSPFDREATTALCEIIETLVGGSAVGRIFQNGISVVVAGATNSGKSSLFNALVRQERSIVSGEHGTTRDYIEALVNIRGVPVRLTDSAGLRGRAGSVEREGMSRTRRLLEESDCVIFLVDGTRGVTEEDRRALDSIGPARVIRVYSKSDLSTEPPPDGYLSTSTVNGDGISDLEERIIEEFGATEVKGSDLLVAADHERRSLVSIGEALHRAITSDVEGQPLDAVAAELADARTSLGLLTGEITRDDILETIFSKFCVGK